MPTRGTILAVLLAWNGAPFLLLGWLFASVAPGGWATVLLLALAWAAPTALLARQIGGDRYPTAFTRILAFRTVWYSLLFLPLLAASGLVGLLVGLPFDAVRPAGRLAVEMTALILVALAIWGYVGTRRLIVRPLDLSFVDLPPGMEGLRIAQLSDLHVGPQTSRRHLTRIAEAVDHARPDLIVLTGDQVDDFARDVEPLGAAFGRLSAPLGVFAIAGNHDVYAGWESVRIGMEALGWTVLVNRAVPVRWNGAQFWIAGTGDPAGGRRPGDSPVAPDVERTLASVPDEAFTLALAHNPALWPELAARGVELTLSGHTHHGQLSIPRLGWSLASSFVELAMGMHRRATSVLYINPGTNFWGIPFRIGALPEVTVATLRRGPAIATTEPVARIGETASANLQYDH